MSGRKNVTEPTLLASSIDLSADYTSLAQNIKFLDNVGIILNFTGTPTGSFLVEFRTKDSPWSDSSLVIPASGVADVHNVNLNQVPYEQYRVRYVRVGGTGSLDIITMSKMV